MPCLMVLFLLAATQCTPDPLEMEAAYQASASAALAWDRQVATCEQTRADFHAANARTQRITTALCGAIVAALAALTWTIALSIYIAHYTCSSSAMQPAAAGFASVVNTANSTGAAPDVAPAKDKKDKQGRISFSAFATVVSIQGVQLLLCMVCFASTVAIEYKIEGADFRSVLFAFTSLLCCHNLNFVLNMDAAAPLEPDLTQRLIDRFGMYLSSLSLLQTRQHLLPSFLQINR